MQNNATRALPTCGYAGCKQTAVIEMTSLINGKVLTACNRCAPRWVLSGEMSAFERQTGRRVYSVRKL